ncbi:MAG: hypothetical protein V4629_00750 [Pseudomonadota bacterium]
MNDVIDERQPLKEASFGNTQETISEIFLMENLASGAVTKMKLVQGTDDKFQIYINISWRKGELLLETQRKKPRTWSSLDRLIHYINEKYQKYESVPVIELYLRSHRRHGKE